MTQVRLALEALRNTFWVMPAAGIALAVVLGLVLPALDASIALPDALSFSGGPETARAML